MMSLDQMAKVLYNCHLDYTIIDSNKELEDVKENYLAIKRLLLVMLPNPKDKPAMLAYIKNAYSSLVTLTKLEIDRGKLVPGLEDYYLSKNFHRTLAYELGDESS